MDRIQHNQGNSNKSLIVKTRMVDTARLRAYFAGVESLVAEARRSRDPRVQCVALDVLAMQPTNIRALVGDTSQ